MRNKTIIQYIATGSLALSFAACKLPELVQKDADKNVPQAWAQAPVTDSTNSAVTEWRNFFTDPYLNALIDSALAHNQERNILLQEIEISRNEIRARKGEYLPSVGLRLGGGVDKVARYTNIGAMEANTEIKPGKEMPEPLTDLGIAAYATWEVDIWHKLRNAKKAAVARYLETIEGRNFMSTNLVAEIAAHYYELLALDNQLAIVEQNIRIQNDALRIVKLQKAATRVTELAVRRFEAQVLNTTSLQYDIRQKITETENSLNFLLGRYPQKIERSSQSFDSLMPTVVASGMPSQLLDNRPDIRRAEQELAASKLDVKVAKAKFYPSLGINASLGYQAFNPTYLLKTPQSLLYSIAGDLIAPLINRNAIKAAYKNANARQIQAVYDYERTVLNAYVEVANQLSQIDNMAHKYELKTQQVQALMRSVDISNELFTSARADYMEVLLTQREALDAKFELIETKKDQLEAMIQVYRNLGGGWR